MRLSMLPKAAAILVAGLALTLVAPFSASADTVVGTITAPGVLGGSGLSEHGSVLSPDGSTLFVTTTSGIAVIDTTTNAVLRNIATPATPEAVAVSPDGKTLYTTLFSSDSLAIIDLGPDTLASIAVGDGPIGVMVSPDGTRVYVRNVNGTGVNGLSVVDTVARSVMASVTTPPGGRSIAQSPDGSRLYLPGFSPSNPNVAVLDTATNSLVGTIVMGTGNRVDGMAFSADATLLYATVPGADGVAVIDPATNTVTRTIPVGDQPAAIAVTADGTRAYVTNFGSNTVSIIDLATNAVTATVPVGSGPRSIRIAPDGSVAYVTNATSQTVSVITIDTFPTITTVALPGGETEAGYSSTISTTGSPAPTLAVTAGTLPPGLVLDGVTGAITGTPTAAGSFSFTVTASSTVSGIPSTVEQAYTIVVAAVVPDAPIDLVATLSGGTAVLTWTAPTFDGGAPITGYRIERSTDGAAFATLVSDTANTAVTYTDAAVAAGHTYTYRVSALNTVGASDPSNTATVTIPAVVPDAPIDLAATLSGGTAILTWTTPPFDGGAPITGYRIERSTDGAAFATLVSDTTNTAVTYTDAAVAAGHTYTYRVSALNTVGASDPSNTATVTIPAATQPAGPTPPTTSSTASPAPMHDGLAATGSDSSTIPLVLGLSLILAGGVAWAARRRIRQS